jgi:peptide methionine sulfoxide reductase msrA/msrB
MKNRKGSHFISREWLNGSAIFDRPVVTEIISFEKFYPAEDYHQDYAEKNPVRYKNYRYHSGRESFIEETWKDERVENTASQVIFPMMRH